MADQDWQARLKTGRNDDCPCGSKKKYKKCHLQADEKAQSEALAKANAEAAEKAKAEGDGHEGHDHPGHEHHGHGHHGHSHGGGHTPKPGSPVVRQVSAPRKAGGGS
ncbi:MAG TPA: SEC-C metal-binding domain-containing protein [bacterium]|nr:SEC-C metal-binding domain-containing protein [bacterium]